MKIDITKAQLEAIKSLADNASATVGGIDAEVSRELERLVNHVDKMLMNNHLGNRDFN